MDVIKIRLQAQHHSMTDPSDIPKYRNAAHCMYVMFREEGIGSLYKGVTLTVIRQGTNQAANFTMDEGYMAFYKGLTPRVMRVAPGQAVTFMVYERVYSWVSSLSQNLAIETFKGRLSD
ncbi:hypothetical protein BASA60_010534 [Batrachochytrium salamandrivorans]|nr:hypothetical protein BASA60_010534 [Batrachochytrium salamandrivorans]